MPDAVEISELCVGLPKRGVLFGPLSMAVREGSITALMGPSGCGKSTLLRAIAGLTENTDLQTTGRVRVFGQEPAAARRRGMISFMFQEPTLLPHMTVLENACFPRRPSDVAGEARDVLRVLGLSDAAGVFPRDLSGGMKSRVALARAVLQSDKLLLLDEPFSGLDVAWKQSLYEAIKAVQALRGLTILLVSHDILEVAELSSEVWVFAAHDNSLHRVLNASDDTRFQTIDTIRDLLVRGHASLLGR